MNWISSSKLIRFLKVLSFEELKSFELWLMSPYFNTNKNLVKLIASLKKHYPLFDSPKLTKEKLFRQIRPNGKFSLRNINNILSEGYLALERFVVNNNLKQDVHLQKNILTQEFEVRNIENWFFKSTESKILSLEKKSVRSWEEELLLYKLHRQLYHYPTQEVRFRPGGTTIVEMGEKIDLVYLLEKAVIISEKILRNRMLNEIRHEVTNEIEKWKIVAEEISHPSLDLYKIRLGAKQEQLKENYFALRKAFFEKFEQLSEKDKLVHLLYLRNDYALMIRQNDLNKSD